MLGTAPPLPGSGFSNWSSSPSASASSPAILDTDVPIEQVVYPLSRPTSQTSFADAAGPYRSLQLVLAQPLGLLSTTSFATASSHGARPPPSPTPRPPRSQSPAPLAYHSLSTPFETASAPSSPITGLDMPSFTFLRRANSVISVPILPPVDSSSNSSFFGPFAKSRKLLANPSASASTNDLPSLDAPRPRSPTPLSGSPPARPVRAVERGAIGPRAGARLLASEEARRALRDAELDGDEDDFSIRERLTGGMVTPANAHSPEKPPPLGQHGPRSASRSRSGSSERVVRRVPVPLLDDDEGMRGEKSIQALTRRASQEDREQADDEDAARLRKASLSKASGAGLGSPFSGQGAATVPSGRKARRPPVAGLNKASVPVTGDAEERKIPIVGAARQRSSSNGSTASLSKDVVLNQLAEAVRREKKKAEMYERECEQGETELAEIARNLEVLKEKFATSLAQQEQVISNLRAEIDELESELEMANELDEEAAQEYLELLTASTSIETLKAKGPVVGAFDLTALQSTSVPTPHVGASAEPGVDKPKRIPFAFRRALSLKRRIDTHVAAYGTVASNSPLPKPSLPRPPLPSPKQAESTALTSTPTNSSDPPRRARKLSKSRATPVGPPISSPVRSPAEGFATSGRAALPPPQSIFPTGTSTTPHPLDAFPRPPRESPPKAKRAPPVSGISRATLSGGQEMASVSDGEREDGGVKGRADQAGRGRKRTNSFKKGVQGTMRMLFPAHAPRAGPRGGSPPGGSVEAWLRAGRHPNNSQDSQL